MKKALKYLTFLFSVWGLLFLSLVATRLYFPPFFSDFSLPLEKILKEYILITFLMASSGVLIEYIREKNKKI